MVGRLGAWAGRGLAHAVSATKAALDNLLTEVAAGSELLYDGLLASSLDGQPLAIAIEAHLVCQAIPAAKQLLRGLCTAAGLCLERAGCALRKQVEALRGQAAAVQAVVVRSHGFWCTMLDGLPDRMMPLTALFILLLVTPRSLQASRTAAVPR